MQSDKFTYGWLFHYFSVSNTIHLLLKEDLVR